MKLNCYQQESNFADKKGSTHKHGSLIENYNISATISTIPHPTYSRYIYISVRYPRTPCVHGQGQGVCGGGEGVGCLPVAAPGLAAVCSMWRAGAVSWPRSARVTHHTLHITHHTSHIAHYTPSIPPMHQEVTHPHPYNWEHAEYRV